MTTAPYFANITNEEISSLLVSPPWEPKNKNIQWLRGNIKTTGEDGRPRDFVITGPKMRVCFSGCRWNKLVLSLGDVDSQYFYGWLRQLGTHVRETVWAAPDKFKPGSKTNARFMWHDVARPSSDPTLYADELHCRLSTYKHEALGGQPGEMVDVVNTAFFTVDEGVPTTIDPVEICAGSYVVPVIKFSYQRNLESFSLVMTVLKAWVFKGEDKNSMKIDNADWVVDYPMDV